MEKEISTLILKVNEALSKDVGRAIARIDPEDMKSAGLDVGDIIQIEGKRKTPAKIMPCYAEDRGKKIIQIDGITRENAQIGLDEKVKIQKIEYKSAGRIRLLPLTVSGLYQKTKDTKYIGSLIEGLPVSAGDRVRATLFGSRSSDYKVIDTSPAGVVIIDSQTMIRMESKKSGVTAPTKISYEDIGGLGNQIQRIREMIELPLRYPQIFERLGIDPPKGVFLYGPPGTGKTLIARAVANETDAYFSHISGPEIMGKFYGESEARLRKIFEDAQAHAPAIIFIDEIDSIAPKREEMGGEKQVERRVVAQLLSLLDGLESRGHVIVIGATNIPNSIDPALRRPGRFDREISIPIPDKNGRLEILQIHTRGMPLADDVSINKLAEITHGFVGADLEALARESAMVALRKILPHIDYEMADIPYDTLMKLGAFDYLTKPFDNEELIITIKKALQTQRLSREVNLLKQQLGEKITFENLMGKSTQIKKVLKQVNLIAPTNMSVIIQGKSGTGKEVIANLIHRKSHRKDKPFIPIDCGAIPESLVESELFGYDKGAFTGADKTKEGKFELANEGTLFLDEITNLPADAQAKILRAIEEKEITHIGGKKSISVDVRIIATTNIDILDAVNQGKFREDLFHRLNQFKILLPTLQERKDDIPILAKIFLEEANKELKKDIKDFSSEALKLLLNYYWSGNIRELKHVIKRAVLLEKSNYITPDSILLESLNKNNSNYDLKISHQNGNISFDKIMKKVERDLISKAIEQANGNKIKAAKMLNMNVRTLYRKMEELNLPL